MRECRLSRGLGPGILPVGACANPCAAAAPGESRLLTLPVTVAHHPQRLRLSVASDPPSQVRPGCPLPRRGAPGGCPRGVLIDRDDPGLRDRDRDPGLRDPGGPPSQLKLSSMCNLPLTVLQIKGSNGAFARRPGQILAGRPAGPGMAPGPSMERPGPINPPGWGRVPQEQPHCHRGGTSVHRGSTGAISSPATVTAAVCVCVPVCVHLSSATAARRIAL
jgi:hypothetical protein